MRKNVCHCILPCSGYHVVASHCSCPSKQQIMSRLSHYDISKRPGRQVVSCRTPARKREEKQIEIVYVIIGLDLDV